LGVDVVGRAEVVLVKGEDGGTGGAVTAVVLGARPAATAGGKVVAGLPVVERSSLATEREGVGLQPGAESDNTAGENGLSTGSTGCDLDVIHRVPPSFQAYVR
jgi:hypothetical protein